MNSYLYDLYRREEAVIEQPPMNLKRIIFSGTEVAEMMLLLVELTSDHLPCPVNPGASASMDNPTPM